VGWAPRQHGCPAYRVLIRGIWYKANLAETRADLAETRADLQREIAEARADLGREIAEAKADILKWMIGMIVGAVVVNAMTVIGAMLALVRIFGH
jgi:hypothetical protein